MKLFKINRGLWNGNNSIETAMLISGICKPLSMIISYLYVPLVLNYLGDEKYGVWATMLTILSWMSYFDVGIGNGLRNKLTKSLVKKDGQSNALVSSAYAFITVIMVAVALVFSLVAMRVDWKVVFGIVQIDENLTSIVVVSACFAAINFILSIYKNVLYAMQKASSVSIIELLTQLVNVSGILLVNKIVDCSLFALTYTYGFSLFIVNSVASIYLYISHKEVRPQIYSIDVRTGKSITNLGLQFLVVQICALVLFATDSLLISYLYGAADVTPYNTVNRVFTLITGVYAAFITPIWNRVAELKSESDYYSISRLLCKLLRVLIPFVIGIIALVVAFRPLARLWLGRDLTYTPLLIALGGMYCFFSIWCNTFATFSNGMQIMKASMIVAIIQAMINIPLSLLFAEKLELQSAGILLGTCCSMLVAAVVLPVIVIREIRSSK